MDPQREWICTGCWRADCGDPVIPAQKAPKPPELSGTEEADVAEVQDSGTSGCVFGCTGYEAGAGVWIGVAEVSIVEAGTCTGDCCCCTGICVVVEGF